MVEPLGACQLGRLEIFAVFHFGDQEGKLFLCRALAVLESDPFLLTLLAAFAREIDDQGVGALRALLDRTAHWSPPCCNCSISLTMAFICSRSSVVIFSGVFACFFLKAASFRPSSLSLRVSS